MPQRMVRIFLCGVCGTPFERKAFLDQHNQTTHGSRVTLPGRLSR